MVEKLMGAIVGAAHARLGWCFVCLCAGRTRGGRSGLVDRMQGKEPRQNANTMKLIGSMTSPYVRKVRIVMAEKKLDYQFLLEDI
jgi:hypothetical protein